MIFKDISILDPNMEVKDHMYVTVKGTDITYVGNKPPDEPDEKLGQVIDGRGKLLMAGFYNAHGHSPMTLMRGYGENMTLNDWLTKRIFPFEALLDGEAVYWATMMAMAESVRYGIVSTTDMYYFSEDMAQAILDSGAKNNLSRSITNFSDGDLWSLKSSQEMVDLYKEYHNKGQGRLKIDMSLHGEYTSTPITVSQLAEYTKEIGGRMHVHVSETVGEHQGCKERHGMTPVEYLNSHGLFDSPTTAAHCVHIEGDDYRILREKGVTVAVNPVSNMKLASGVCNVPALVENQVNIAIGTDSVASNNNLNFMEEIKLFTIGPAMMYNNLSTVTPAMALKAATVGGASSQGREDCGLLTEGYKADLIVVNIDSPTMEPVHNMVNNLVFSADPTLIEMTIVDGQILYNKGEYTTMDIEKIKYQVKKSTSNILGKLA